MADLKAFTPKYSFPYPLAGDSVQNTYTRIADLALEVEKVLDTLGIDYPVVAGKEIMQRGDNAGGDLAGSTYPNPTITASAVTTSKINDLAVTTVKIDNLAVTTGKIANDAVTTAKLDVVALKDGSTAVTQPQSDNSTKVATTAYVDAYVAGSVPDGSIGTSELADGAVTNAKVNASAAIAYSKLNLAGSIVNADVATGAAIAYSKLALNNSILESDLAFNIATQTELDNHTNATTSVHGISNTANLVYTNDSRLTDSRNPTGSAGGVLSGTYPNPSFAVDMATQTELDNHASDTTSVHGIADTSVLATQTDVSTAVSTHSSDTTSVHGISDTANLVYTNDSRLTDSRTPTGSAGGVLSGSYPNPGFAVDMATQTELDNHASDTTSVHGIADTSVLATATDVSTAVSTHSSDTTSVHGISNTADLVLTGDARLSDARTPTSHASTHVPGGSDAIDLTKIIAVGATLPTLPDPLYPAGTLFGVGSIAPYLLYRSTGSAWDQIGGAGGSSVTTSDTAPSTPSDGDLWYKTSNAKTYVWYEDGSSNQWVEAGAASQLVIPQHGSSHVRGGVDVIDGDRLTIDYVPTNYTRNSGASGAGNVTDLTAHLAGIDLILPAGILMPYAGTTEPNGWVFCYGQTVDSVANTAYARLFAAIGTTYGGSGASSFILPDLRGRVAAGRDNMGGTTIGRLTNAASGITGTTLGASGGLETHTLTIAEMPSHSHQWIPKLNGSRGTTQNMDINGAGTDYGLDNSFIGATGGSGAHRNVQPTLVTNYIIKL